jgi:hypothetical protein
MASKALYQSLHTKTISSEAHPSHQQHTKQKKTDLVNNQSSSRSRACSFASTNASENLQENSRRATEKNNPLALKVQSHHDKQFPTAKINSKLCFFDTYSVKPPHCLLKKQPRRTTSFPLFAEDSHTKYAQLTPIKSNFAYHLVKDYHSYNKLLSGALLIILLTLFFFLQKSSS